MLFVANQLHIFSVLHKKHTIFTYLANAAIFNLFTQFLN